MRKLIINIVALTGLAISVTYAGCTVHRHNRHYRSYSIDRYHYYDNRGDYNRGHRYEPPRQY